ncbi:MAG: DUF177 domain-containing protein [Candidatus Margulisiibacteriota bacterium]
MRLDLTDLLRNTGNEANIDEELKVNFAEDGLRATKPVHVRLHLANTGPLVLMDGTAETEFELECSRCGKMFTTSLAADISEEYSKNPREVTVQKGKEVELRDEDFVYRIEPDNTLDLNEVARQDLILALPLQTICGGCQSNKGEK